jgi:hypothetical protein
MQELWDLKDVLIDGEHDVGMELKPAESSIYIPYAL